MREIAYQVGAGWCAVHERVHAASGKEAAAAAGRLRKALSSPGEGARWAAMNDGSYGIATQGDCEHVWSMSVDAAGRHIVAIRLDAEDGVWTPSRRDFSK